MFVLPSRRVRKGRPGNRAQSEKRQWFLWLITEGWSVYAARREVGVSRTTGANWIRGYKIHRDGRGVGHVPALDPLMFASLSTRFLSLSQDGSVEIADLRQAGPTFGQIAAEMGRSPSTTSREMRRDSRTDGQYRPFDAHRAPRTAHRAPRTAHRAAATTSGQSSGEP
ncbi:helix-turn-helix domain-containing protein [Pseudonocardia alni]|uniref:helix-turn-helix domain-containing protein n=1 Tax=Pseudonocardia alni TaxID=33907 RepID=UPI003325E9BB